MYSRKDTLLCLRNSKPFSRFSKAFEKITGMHVFLLKMSSIDDLMEAIHATHPICSLIAKSPEACQRCRESIETCVDAAVKSGHEVVTCRCPFGLWRTVIPISTGSKPVFLYSGRVLLGRRGGYENIRAAFLNNLRGFLSPALINSSRDAASRVQVLSPRIYAADVEMLRLLGREMKLVAPSIKRRAQQTSVLSPFVLRAKTLINERHAEPLHLDQVAICAYSAPTSPRGNPPAPAPRASACPKPR